MKTSFIGTYFYSMDSKNRLAIPAKFREELESEDGVVLAQGLEGCLSLYTPDAWQRLHEKLESFPLRNKIEQRAFKRMLFASACNIELDEEGRVLIPQQLVSYAGLKRDAVIIGMGPKVEIWSKTVWEKYQKKQQSAFTRHASDLEV